MPEVESPSDNTIWQACLLAAVGGTADAVGFLTFNAFACAMTGNTVLLGIALATDKLADAAESAGIIASFLVGVAASAWLHRTISLAGLLCLEMAAIALVGGFWLSYLAGVVAGALAWKWTAHPLLFAILPLPLVLLRRSAWRSGG